MKRTACTTAGSDGEVFFAHFDAFLFIGPGYRVLETRRVRRVARNGNVDTFVVHDGYAFADVVGTEAADGSAFALGVGNFPDDVQFTGLVIKLGLDIGEAVDTGNDLGRILAEAV